MATIKELREAIADRLKTVDGIGQTSPYQLGSPTPPCAWPSLQGTERLAMGTHDVAPRQVTFVVNVLVPASLEEAAQRMLDELVDSGAVPAALEADQTLGGVASSVYSPGLTSYEAVVYGDNQAGWRAQYEVTVTA